MEGYRPARLANSWTTAPGGEGTLISPPFVIERPWLNFLVGGGLRGDPMAVGIDLLIGNRVVRTATGHARTGGDSAHLRPHSWDLSEFLGASARLRIRDHAGGE